MNLVELDNALRKLRLSGMADALETRLRQAQADKMAPLDLVSALVSDELLRRQDRLFERRTKQAAQKIAQAEAAAIKEVRTTATEAAIAAASRLVGEAVQGAAGGKLIDESIAAVKSRLN